MLFRRGVLRGPWRGMAAAAALWAAAALGQTSIPPWQADPFAASAADVLRAAERVAAPGGEGAVILLRDGRYVFQADGSCTYRYRQATRVMTVRGIEQCSTLQTHWAPWYQKRPEIRARVITANGAEKRLDPEDVTEAPALPHSLQTFSDARILRAHFPGVGVGSVVETELTVAESHPLIDAGTLQRFDFGADVPVERARLVIEAPATLPLAYRARLLPGVEPRREEEGGRLRLTFESGPFPAELDPEPFLPPEVPRGARVTFATGASWNALARSYERLVEERVAEADLKSVAKEAVAGERGKRERVERLLARLAEVRYTGVFLGKAAIVPASPQATLERKYGDCKDKATALVALLRAVGIEARVALLNAGLDEDVEADLAGMGAFNHAIVHVDDPPLWIDPTDEHAAVGQLPEGDQGRLALIADASTLGLVRTPEAPAAENRLVETREVTLADAGPGRVVQTLELHGVFARAYRRELADHRKEALAELADTLREELGTAVAPPVASADPIPAPVRFRLEVAEAKGTDTAKGEAASVAGVGTLLAWLPAGVLGKRERTQDLVASTTVRLERRYVLTAPRGYEPAPLPRAASWTAGPLTYQEDWQKTPEGKVEGAIVIELPRRRLTAAEVTALRKEVTERLEARRVVVRFRDPRTAR